jgi:hypothetical protein
MLPNTHLRFFMPMKRGDKGSEGVPQANLLYMCGDKIRYETKLESSPGEK